MNSSNLTELANPSIIVAIDDDENILAFYCEALQDLCTIYTFTNPQDGLNFIRQHSITAAIIDRRFPRFPGMNGDDLCQQIRLQPQTQNLPIIIASGIDEIDEISSMMRKNRIDTYITKPMEIERLRSQVEFYIRMQQNPNTAANATHLVF